MKSSFSIDLQGACDVGLDFSVGEGCRLWVPTRTSWAEGSAELGEGALKFVEGSL